MADQTNRLNEMKKQYMDSKATKSSKKDLEIIYNLEWKNRPANGGDKANIIGVYDIPATTLNWETFKSYLLKNSGTVGDDVKVSYITTTNREFPIESQTDFQIALYAFRRRARSGEVVNLTLDRKSDQPRHKNIRHSNDVETQFDNKEDTSPPNWFVTYMNQLKSQSMSLSDSKHDSHKITSFSNDAFPSTSRDYLKSMYGSSKDIPHLDVETQSEINEPASFVSTACCSSETPPEWFTKYMDMFKKNITEEITATVSSVVSNIKMQQVSQPCYHSRKSKTDSSKRMLRKIPPLHNETMHETKDLLKSLKLEGKLERKLEKLEHKTKKIKEKKLALVTKTSDSDASRRSSNRSPSVPSFGSQEDLCMDASAVNHQAVVPHMLGGELYMHKWEVKNTGKAAWTSKTTLNYTWGSKSLKPLEMSMSVPYLKPGETGTLAVRLQVPNSPGPYECYWHFYHKERRFGQWLGCQIIVDSFDLKGNKSVLERSLKISDGAIQKQPIDVNDKPEQTVHEGFNILNYEALECFNVEPNEIDRKKKKDYDSINRSEEGTLNVFIVENDKFFLRTSLASDRDIKVQNPTDTNCSSDSDNQSIVSLSESNSSKSLPEEFILVPIPECFKVEQKFKRPLELETLGPWEDENEETQVDAQTYMKNSSTPNSKTNSIEKLCDGVSSSDVSAKSDLVVISMASDEEDEGNSGLAYVMVDGQKISIPKKIIKSEYLKPDIQEESQSEDTLRNASSASNFEITNEPQTTQDFHSDLVVAENSKKTLPSYSSMVPFFENPTDQTEILQPKREIETNLSMPHFTTAISNSLEVKATNMENMNSSRLFIFPQTCPGYEVVYPTIEKQEKQIHQPGVYGFEKAEPCDLENDVAGGSAPPLNLSTRDRNPFSNYLAHDTHVPNYQQTPPDQRKSVAMPPEGSVTYYATSNISPELNIVDSADAANASFPSTTDTKTSVNSGNPDNTQSVHVLPEFLMSGAVNAASTAFNTARSVINMIVPRDQPEGKWENGHWVTTNPASPREANLQSLAEMGFWNRDLNATLLARYNDDLSRVVAELVQ